ncbi:hypothetical protein LX76_04183 [Cereibacter changlensis]|uniref:Uncharacterized protein n=1 Tax=Cereibacter changlensis TaxID=402884 RepID=A0A2W7SDA8_9RHOB|nr:hypothetical protein LX76_04183 [Cereibacter changlensis]
MLSDPAPCATRATDLPRAPRSCRWRARRHGDRAHQQAAVIADLRQARPFAAVIDMRLPRPGPGGGLRMQIGIQLEGGFDLALGHRADIGGARDKAPTARCHVAAPLIAPGSAQPNLPRRSASSPRRGTADDGHYSRHPISRSFHAPSIWSPYGPSANEQRTSATDGPRRNIALLPGGGAVESSVIAAPAAQRRPLRPASSEGRFLGYPSYRSNTCLGSAHFGALMSATRATCFRLHHPR